MSAEIETALRDTFSRMVAGDVSPGGPPHVPTWSPWYTEHYPVSWPPDGDHRAVSYGMARSIWGISDAEWIAGPWVAITDDLATGTRTFEILADRLERIGVRGLWPLGEREKAAERVLAPAQELFMKWVRTGVAPEDPELVRMDRRRRVYLAGDAARVIADRHPEFFAWLEEGEGIAAYRSWIGGPETIDGVEPSDGRSTSGRHRPWRVEPLRRRLRRRVRRLLLVRRFCSSCGAENGRERAFCRRCGSSL